MSFVWLHNRIRINDLFTALFDTPYWREQALRRQLLFWLCLGVAVRLVLMPFTAHNDFLDSHWRSEQMVERKIPYPTRTQFLSHAADAAWLLVITPLLPERAQIFAAPPSKNGRLDAEPVYFNQFVGYAAAQRALFLTKLIYLFVDVVTAFALLYLFEHVDQGISAFRLWMLNPATIFAVFIYGRYESYALLCLVLSLVLIKREHILFAALMLGVAIAFRATPILLLPIYMLGLTKRRLHQIGLLVAGLLPQLLIVVVMEWIFKYIPAYNVDHRTGPLSGLTNTVFTPFSVFPFLVTYILILFWIDRQTSSLQNVVRASLGIYLLIYMFTWHSAHYISWLAPFIVPVIAWGRISARYYGIFLVAWAFYWLTATDAGVFTAYLFSPLFGYAYLPVPPGQVIARWITPLQLDYNQLVIAARSLLCAVAGWMLLQLRSPITAEEGSAKVAVSD